MQSAPGWRIDPFATHELRYFMEGRPTSWVCTAGKVTLETVAPVREFVGAGIGPAGTGMPAVPPGRPLAEAPSAPALAAWPTPEPPTSGPGECRQDLLDGWQADPLGSHEFRYYDAGEPTSWVATGGVVSEEYAVTMDQFLGSIGREDLGMATGNAALGTWAVDDLRVDEIGGQIAGLPDPVASEFFRRGERGPGSELGGPMSALPTQPDPMEAFLRTVNLAAATGVAPRPDTLRAWSILEGDPWAEEPAGIDSSGTEGAVVRAPTGPGGRTRRAAVVAGAVGALALVTSLAAFAATGGPDHASRRGGGAPTRASHVAPATVATAPTVANPTATWWKDTAQPATAALLADIQAMSGQVGAPSALAASCHTFGGDAAAAAAAPPAPIPAIQREWQQTLATVNRIAAACASGRLSRVAEDLQPASLTIHDLSVQVANDLR